MDQNSSQSISGWSRDPIHLLDRASTTTSWLISLPPFVRTGSLLLSRSSDGEINLKLSMAIADLKPLGKLGLEKYQLWCALSLIMKSIYRECLRTRTGPTLIPSPKQSTLLD